MNKYKTIGLFLTTAAILFFSSCRKESDEVPYIGESHKLAYSTYEEQFIFLWKSMSTGYVFWDVDTTDWNAMYDRMLPRFQALDQKYNDSGYVRTQELKDLYTQVYGNLRDHHLSAYVENLHPAPSDASAIFSVVSSNIEIPTRDYYIESRTDATLNLQLFLGNIGSEGYTVVTHETGTYPFYEEAITSNVTYHYILFRLADGRLVPYLWQSMAAVTPVIRRLGGSDATAAGAQLLDHWFRAITETPRSQLAGIILDNRCNRGGYQDDLDYLFGSFLNERTVAFSTRYKEGPGRLEHSAWMPYYINTNPLYHRDITAEDIPFVILCDIYSISMGEIEPMGAKVVLPTVHTIGERTCGATGPLQPATDINLNYGGPFGDANDIRGHYIYTSSFESSFDGKVYEGIGHTPDEVVLRKDHGGSFKPQLDAAFNYIMNY